MTSLTRLPFVFALTLAACAASSPPGPAAPAPPSSEEPGAAPGTTVSSPPEPGSVAGGPSEPGGLPATTWKEHDLGVSVPSEWRTCSAAGDCTLVVTTCCDQCNNGKAVAVNTAHAKDAQAMRPKSCDGVACTERGCMTRAACNAGRCVLEWQSAGP